MLIYATYNFESRDKHNFIAMKNIQQMNEEFKNILMTLPEGIILLNANTKEVALGNLECRRLL